MNFKILIIFFYLFSTSLFSQVSKLLDQTNDEISLAFQREPARFRGGYGLQKEIFKIAQAKMNQNDFNDFRKWYYGTFFYDMTSTIQWNLKGQYPKIKYFAGYDKKGDRPLEGYITTKEYTQGFKAPETSPENLARIQKMLLHRDSIFTPTLKVAALDMAYIRNSEGARDSQLDKNRNYDVFFKMGFTLDKFHRIVSNRSEFKNLKWSKPTNPFVKYSINKTSYLNPVDHFNFEDCLRRQIPKSTCTGIQENMGMYKANKMDKNSERFYKEWLIGYTNEALRELKTSLNKAQTNWDVITATANFHYSLVSIHPFGNGNGRTTRVIAEKILEDYNLPPPIGYPFGYDVTFSKNDFSTIVGDGVALSKKFHEDLLTFLNSDIPYSYVSSHYLAPGLLPWKIIGTTKVVPKEYMAWIMQYTSKSSENETYSITNSIAEFLNWRKKADPKTLNLFYNLTSLPKAYW